MKIDRAQNFYQSIKWGKGWVTLSFFKYEDDLHVTETGHHILGNRVPMIVEEVENTMKS